MEYPYFKIYYRMKTASKPKYTTFLYVVRRREGKYFEENVSVLDIGYLDPKMYVSVKKYHNREHRFFCAIYIGFVYIYH